LLAGVKFSCFKTIIQLNVHMGNLTPFCPKAKCDDGLLDLIILNATSLGNTVNIFNQANHGGHIDGTIVELFQVRSYTVEPIGKSKQELEGDNTTNLDGELVGWSPFTVTCVPKAVTVVVGIDHV
jgi:diacylglycerol kinase family enzyme